MPTDRTQREEKKRGVICRVIMFSSKVMVFKRSENANFFVFSTNNSKTFVKIWAICLSTPARSYRVLAENGMVNSLWTQLFVR